MKNDINQIKKYIENGQSATVNGMPGVGISLFLKELCEKDFADFYYIDIFGLSDARKNKLLEEICRILKISGSSDPLQSIINTLSSKPLDKPLVFACAGFDKLEKNLNKDLFDDLRAIRNVDRKNIQFVFGVCKRLETILPDEVMDSEISMLSTKLYLKPYSLNDSLYLLKKYGPTVENANEKIKLSGGHFQLLQLLLQTEYPTDPLKDEFIKLSLKNIYSHLSKSQKQEIQKIARGGDIQDLYLLNIGVISENNTLFSPLFEQFILDQKTKKIPAKEGVLYRLLKSRNGKVVSKDEIFKIVWRQNPELVSDWALDSLIYRLRKNEIFQNTDYRIESIKKQGYRLVKI